MSPVSSSVLKGSDGFFSINSTSGCISLTSFPVQLRNELYELKVKVVYIYYMNISKA